MLQIQTELPTGTAKVEFGSNREPAVTICRPAAYDVLKLSKDLFNCAPKAKRTLQALLYSRALPLGHHATPRRRKNGASAEVYVTLLMRACIATLPRAHRFYDLNLRPGCFTPQLVGDLLAEAHALKLNEEEMKTISCLLDLPSGSMEAFCTAGSVGYGWDAAAVTLGPRGCAVWIKGEYAEADGVAIQVSDTVGAGDAFSAAFLHGLDRGWRPCRIAAFANQVGAIVASRPGGIPEWSLDEILTPQDQIIL